MFRASATLERSSCVKRRGYLIGRTPLRPFCFCGAFNKEFIHSISPPYIHVEHTLSSVSVGDIVSVERHCNVAFILRFLCDCVSLSIVIKPTRNKTCPADCIRKRNPQPRDPPVVSVCVIRVPYNGGLHFLRHAWNGSWLSIERNLPPTCPDSVQRLTYSPTCLRMVVKAARAQIITLDLCC